MPPGGSEVPMHEGLNDRVEPAEVDEVEVGAPDLVERLDDQRAMPVGGPKWPRWPAPPLGAPQGCPLARQQGGLGKRPSP